MTNKKVAIIGAGRFGSHLAFLLSERGTEVMIIDENMDHLEDVKDFVTVAVQLDARDPKELQQQDIKNFDVVVVAIGNSFESAMLVIAALQEINVKNIVTRATTAIHEKIFRHMGIKEIIAPTVEAAERLADRLLFKSVIDSLQISPAYTIIEAIAPKELHDKTVKELNLIENYNLHLVTIKRGDVARTDHPFSFNLSKKDPVLGILSPDTVIHANDILVIFGENTDIEKFLTLQD